MVISIQPTIPFFEGKGYDTWSIKMRTLFISEDLWELVDKGYVEEEIPRDAMRDVRKNDAKALFFIQQAITESIFPQISKATKSKEAWDTLQTKYQSTSLVAAQDGDGSQTDIPVMDDSVYEAAAKGDIDVLKKIPESEFHAQLSPKHNTILHIASEFGKIECVNWILDLPSSSSLLQRPNLNEDTPLHLAARQGHLEVVEALINAAREPTLDIETGPGPHKVMLRMKNKGKDTALHEAVRYRNYGVVMLLIEEDPDFTYGANDSGITPLYMAVEGGFTAAVKLIIEKSSTSPSYNGLMGRTALHAAVICNDIEMTKTILEWKPDLTKEVDKNGWSPLHYAAERGCDPEIVRLLLEKSEKSVAYLRSKDGKKTALHIASFHHHTKIVEKILSHSPGCREQVDDKGNNIFHFAMMKEGDDDFNPSSYFFNYWLRSRGLVNEKNAQGNTPIHLLSLNQILDFRFVWNYKVDKKAYNNEDLTAYDIILRDKEDISEEKDRIQSWLEAVTTGRISSFWEKETKRQEIEQERKEYISQLQKQGETHLIVSALITTVTFAAGFTLPGGYKEDDGQAILSKKAAFRAFVVTDTIAMVSSLCAVFLHFLMTLHKRGKFLEKHLLWAFSLTMVGMGAMAIAFATGLYAVLPHSSGLSVLTCILCSCFFLSIAVEYCKFWRGTISEWMFG
ncbi:protein ACCELERATED CELL DEATH 6 isoform X1 [Vitis vinifera]|nr:protein ACCELERATED CELL DEATH 6 isoform X1 [Vitis vinifera]|eukprot:XP_010650279.1 PREDICTED: protein ACCELERATED CELL DEATH 6 isoform X1 [Vitis vinifera]